MKATIIDTGNLKQLEITLEFDNGQTQRYNCAYQFVKEHGYIFSEKHAFTFAKLTKKNRKDALNFLQNEVPKLLNKTK